MGCIFDDRDVFCVIECYDCVYIGCVILYVVDDYCVYVVQFCFKICDIDVIVFVDFVKYWLIICMYD